MLEGWSARLHAVRGVVWLSAALMAFLVGATFTSARASHGVSVNYHCSVTCHGLVHGSSTTDNNWHARQEAGGNTDVRYCAAIVTNFGPAPERFGSSTIYGLSGTCNYWVDPARGADEDASGAEIEGWAGSSNVVSLHLHPLLG